MCYLVNYVIHVVMGVVNVGPPFIESSPEVVWLARSVVAVDMSIDSFTSSSSNDVHISV